MPHDSCVIMDGHSTKSQRSRMKNRWSKNVVIDSSAPSTLAVHFDRPLWPSIMFVHFDRPFLHLTQTVHFDRSLWPSTFIVHFDRLLQFTNSKNFQGQTSLWVWTRIRIRRNRNFSNGRSFLWLPRSHSLVTKSQFSQFSQLFHNSKSSFCQILLSKIDSFSKEERKECNQQIKALWRQDRMRLKQKSKTYRELKPALENPLIMMEALNRTLEMKMDFASMPDDERAEKENR